MSDKPYVSVIMPVYNAMPYIYDAVGSVLGQSFKDFELILIDDGSTDDSWTWINNQEDERIRCFKNDKNCGAATAKNRGVDEAHGKYIAFLDADDWAYPNRLEKQVQFLDKHTAYMGVSSYMIYMDEEGQSKGQYFKHWESPDRLSSSMLFYNSLPQSTLMFRREVFDKNRFTPGMEPAEDYHLWVYLARHDRIYKLQKTLVMYRLHDGGVSVRRSEKMVISVRAIVKDQLNLLNMNPTLDEVDFHIKCGQFSFEISESFLTRFNAWLHKLFQANDKSMIYPQKAFISVLNDFWYHACLANCSLGICMIHIYMKGLIKKGSPVKNTARTLILLRHCLPSRFKK